MRRQAKAPSVGSAEPSATTASAGTTRARRTLFGLACLCVLGLAAFLGSGAPSVGAAEAFPGQGFLPDNRAWEMVSPPDKNGGQVAPTSQRTHAATDGSGITFISSAGFADVQGTGIGTEYMALRDPAAGGNGWLTHGITPPEEQQPVSQIALGGESAYEGELSPDLATGAFLSYSPLTEDPEVANVQNIYVARGLRTPGAASFGLQTGCPACSGTPLEFSPFVDDRVERPLFLGASSDFRHTVFIDVMDLTGDGEGLKLYAADDGAVRLVGVVPSGGDADCGGAGPACVLPVGPGGNHNSTLGRTWIEPLLPHVISDDGTRVDFTAPVSAEGYSVTTGQSKYRSNVYQRDSHGTPSTADDTTVKLNASERVSPASHDAALYQTASADGRRVFFTSKEPLTDDAVGGVGVNHLYMYDFDHANDEVQKLTVEATGGQFKLSLAGEETGNLPFDATDAEVAAALEALPSVEAANGEIEVTGGPGDETGTSPYTVVFKGGLAETDEPTMTTVAGLSGGAEAATVAPWVKGGGHLTLIDKDHEPADAPGSDEGVLGASEDGRYVYFAARGQLVSGAPVLGSELTDDPGVYLWHDGEIRYVGSLSKADLSRDVPSSSRYDNIGGSRVAPDGKTLLFTATDGSGLPTAAFPAGYDHNTTGCGYESQEPCAELYVYHADPASLQCASCRPSGALPHGDAFTVIKTASGSVKYNYHLSHALSDDGRYAFFSSTDRILPADRDGTVDAYEYDTATGRVHLLSSGSSDKPSYFADASTDGSDAFFLTVQRLSGWDVDGATDLYDARIAGGIPEPTAAPPSCQGDACQPAPAQLNDPTPSSSSYAGPGNAAEGASCAAPARRAQRLAHRARRLRRRARSAMRHGDKRGAHKFARAAKARAKRAHGLSRRAKRCRRTNRRAGK